LRFEFGVGRLYAVTDPGAIAWEVMEYLLARLRDADLGSVNVAPAETHMANGALFGFDRAGLFDKQQAEEWRERVSAETRGLLDLMRDETEHRMVARLTAPPPVERTSVEQLLEQQLRMVEIRRSSVERWGALSLAGVSAAREAGEVLLRALAELGLVDELGERQWRTRFDGRRIRTPNRSTPIRLRLLPPRPRARAPPS
jgi:hypothetical protein